MLGAGNDTLNIQSTLQPGGDFNPITGLRGELAHHGGITAVQGGGNALLRVDGTFELTAASGACRNGRAARPPGRPLVAALRLRRRPAGHARERRLVHDHRLRDGPYGLGDTMYLGGGPAPAPPAFTGSLDVHGQRHRSEPATRSGDRRSPGPASPSIRRSRSPAQARTTASTTSPRSSGRR